MRLGDAFTGYGGLGAAVASVYDAQTVWVADNDTAATRTLRWHHPHTPNLGDLTAVDWAKVEPVDILCAGTPCQDLSHAGPRGGMTEGTRSNLWQVLVGAIEVMRPRLLVWENVVGAYSACADSDLGRCPRCVGADTGQPHQPRLRALGRVLGDLSSLGYDARWHAVRASDIGAPHQRTRIFLLAHQGAAPPQPATQEPAPGGTRPVDLLPTPRVTDGTSGPGQHGDGGPDLRTLLATPAARDGKGSGQASRDWLTEHGALETDVLDLLPTPSVVDMGDGKDPDQWAQWTEEMDAVHHNGNGHGRSLSVEAQADWGRYQPAIDRWARLTRPAPEPLEDGPSGKRLSAEFSEWMMGLPAGHVTGVPGLSRKAQLRLLGNGVVPPQAVHAIRTLLTWKAP